MYEHSPFRCKLTIHLIFMLVGDGDGSVEESVVFKGGRVLGCERGVTFKSRSILHLHVHAGLRCHAFDMQRSAADIEDRLVELGLIYPPTIS